MFIAGDIDPIDTRGLRGAQRHIARFDGQTSVMFGEIIGAGSGKDSRPQRTVNAMNPGKTSILPLRTT